MSRRAVPSRRSSDGDSIPLSTSLQQKSKSSPLISIGLVAVGALLLIGYSYSSGGFGGNKEVSHLGEGASCTLEVQRAIPILKKAYGDGMRKVLHVGPETCSVVFKLLKEEDTEAWGVEPYDLEETDSSCRSLVRKGIVRVADIEFPLPYRPKSFSLVIVSDALDYLSPKYLNKTLPDLARVSTDGLVVFVDLGLRPEGETDPTPEDLAYFQELAKQQLTSSQLPSSTVPSFQSNRYRGQQRAKLSEIAKFGRPAKLRSASWWIRYFFQTGLEENEAATKKFEQAANKRSYKPSCQIFHLTS